MEVSGVKVTSAPPRLDILDHGRIEIESDDPVAIRYIQAFLRNRGGNQAVQFTVSEPMHIQHLLSKCEVFFASTSRPASNKDPHMEFVGNIVMEQFKKTFGGIALLHEDDALFRF
jgi:hypothetical protein